MVVEFYKVAEEMESLTLEDKLYLKDLLEKMVVEEKRGLIKKHSQESLKELEEGKIQFGSLLEVKKELYGD